MAAQLGRTVKGARGASSLPSTTTLSFDVTFIVGASMSVPFTVTRRAAIISSAARRLHTSAAAIRFATRSPSANGFLPLTPAASRAVGVDADDTATIDGVAGGAATRIANRGDDAELKARRRDRFQTPSNTADTARTSTRK